MKIKDIILNKRGLRVVAYINGKKKSLKCGQSLSDSTYISQITLDGKEKFVVITNTLINKKFQINV